MLEDLVKAIKNRQAILFAGAGVSMNVGLPSWRTLIEHMGKELGFDPEDEARQMLQRMLDTTRSPR